MNLYKANFDNEESMSKINPTGTGSFSMNRKTDSVVGSNSATVGLDNTAQGDNSFAEGCYTTALGESQHVQGKYNVEDTENEYAHVVGNGTADDARSNAHTLDWDGNAWFAGDVKATDQEGNEVSLNSLKPSKTESGYSIYVKDSADLPIIDVAIQGYTEQTGVPTPESPVDVKGVGNDGSLIIHSHKSKNLLLNTADTQTVNDVTFTVNDNKSITVNGTASADVDFLVGMFKCLPNTRYVLNGCPNGGSVDTYCMYIDSKEFLVDEGAENFNVVVMSENIHIVNIKIGIASGTVIDNLTFHPMMRLEEITDTTYEPYDAIQTNITLSSPLYDGDALLKVDNVYRAFRKNARLSLNGSEEWSYVVDDDYAVTYGPYFKLTVSEGIIKKNSEARLYSSHFSNISDPCVSNTDNVIFMDHFEDGSNLILIRMSNYTTIDDFKTWLTNNNVILIYEVESPYYDDIDMNEIKTLKTYSPTTLITNDDYAFMRITYVNQTYSDSLGMIFNNIPEGMTEEDVLNVIKSNVVNNLTSTTTNLPLSAYQGKRLYDYLCDFLKNVSRASYVYHGQGTVSSGSVTYALPYAVHLPDHSRIYITLELPYTDSSIKTDLGTVSKAIMLENEYNTNKLGSTVNGTGSSQGIIVGNGSTKWKVTVEYNAYYIKISNIQRAVNYSESYSTVSSGTLRVYSRIDWYICSLSSLVS